jgi:hypothetical protein
MANSERGRNDQDVKCLWILLQGFGGALVVRLRNLPRNFETQQYINKLCENIYRQMAGG